MYPDRRTAQPPHVRTVTPTAVIPAAEQQLAPCPPPGMRVIGYVHIDGVLHPQYGPEYTPTPYAAPPTARGVDPQAQRTAARGLFAVGLGGGAYLGMQALQILVDSLVRLITAAVVIGVVWAVQKGRRPVRETPTFVTNNRGFLAGWKSQNGPRK